MLRRAKEVSTQIVNTPERALLVTGATAAGLLIGSVVEARQGHKIASALMAGGAVLSGYVAREPLHTVLENASANESPQTLQQWINDPLAFNRTIQDTITGFETDLTRPPNR